MNTTQFGESIFSLKHSVCAGVAIALTLMVSWSILASTSTVRWMGSDAVAAGYTAAVIMPAVGDRLS